MVLNEVLRTERVPSFIQLIFLLIFSFPPKRIDVSSILTSTELPNTKTRENTKVQTEILNFTATLFHQNDSSARRRRKFFALLRCSARIFYLFGLFIFVNISYRENLNFLISKKMFFWLWSVSVCRLYFNFLTPVTYKCTCEDCTFLMDT